MRLFVFAFALIAGLAAILASPASAATVGIDVGDRWFCDSSFENGVCTTTVQAGDQVTWDFSGAIEAHTVTECGANCDNPTSSPLFDSGLITGGEGPFSHTFSQPGTYLYLCQVHAFEMRGQIVVQGAAATSTPVAGATSTPPSGQTPGATSTPGVSGAPQAGGGPAQGDGFEMWLIITALAGLALGGMGLGARLWAGARAATGRSTWHS